MSGQNTCSSPPCKPIRSRPPFRDPAPPGPPARAATRLGPPDPCRITTRRWIGPPASGQPQFLYQQADTAQIALDSAFDPPRPAEEVLFQLSVTKAWLEQLILALVLNCHSSYRGVIALFPDLFDTEISLGTVHNVVQAAVARAREINGSYDLAGVRVGAHDEIFQAGRPVLVGVDTASTFCYLLSRKPAATPTPGGCGCWNWPTAASPPTPSSPTSAPASAARPWRCPGFPVAAILPPDP